MKIGFIGLGNVGGKLAGSLHRNKFDLTVHDLDAAITDQFKSKDVKIERGFGSSISLNLKIKKFLISVTRNANKFKFKNYTCKEENCKHETTALVNDYGSTTNSFLIGFGYNF